MSGSVGLVAVAEGLVVGVAIVRGTPFVRRPHRRGESGALGRPASSARSRWQGRASARRRARRRLDAELPRLAEAVARELAAGAALAAAIGAAAESVGPELGREVERVLADVDAGVSLRSALAAWRTRCSARGVGQFVAVAQLSLKLGGETAPAFAAVGSSLRDHLELDDELRALTSQSRASAALLTGLPPAAALGLGAIEPATLRFLVGSPLGLAGTVVAAGLTAAGWTWMSWLVGGVR